MADRIRAFDWSTSPLGPRETWSAALRATVGVMLANRFPLLLWSGPDYISLCADPRQEAPGGARLAGPRVLVGNLGHSQAADRHPVQRRSLDLKNSPPITPPERETTKLRLHDVKELFRQM